MSEEKMMQLDEEVLEVANRSRRKQNRQEGQVDKTADAACSNEQHDAELKEHLRELRRYRAKKLLQLIVKVLLCLIGAFAFLMMLFVDWWVPVMAYTGIAFFLVVASITVDRFVRRCR